MWTGGDTLQPTASLPPALGVPEPQGAPPSCWQEPGGTGSSPHTGTPWDSSHLSPGVLVHYGAEPLLEPIKCEGCGKVHLDAAQVIFFNKKESPHKTP